MMSHELKFTQKSPRRRSPSNIIISLPSPLLLILSRDCNIIWQKRRAFPSRASGGVKDRGDVAHPPGASRVFSSRNYPRQVTAPSFRFYGTVDPLPLPLFHRPARSRLSKNRERERARYSSKSALKPKSSRHENEMYVCARASDYR